MTKETAATKAERPAPTRKRRCDSSGLVAKLRRTLIPYCSSISQKPFSIAVQHPADQAFQITVGKLPRIEADRKSTRLNSSHTVISYAVFCLKKKKKTKNKKKITKKCIDDI